ncbi:aminotransferase class V-fold PLP-dependent enzyme [Pelagibius litoralis]|uniref:Aminotransferase class V-fold PLP-dependent enzyme n=1 Tax=Pelagibius litoralis TaxID=374515 RepID=A0A967C1R3_9PROT|nr:aminotransferase class V-fold PLP-dependent enzyme [Pelagibius litoralis]NIA67696.1 aminotransferase class V-fold PLP-dependent enzyme [Pelagibius litoralis]
MPQLDLAFARAQFPAFSEPSLKDWAFFENAGGSYACGPVIDRLTRFYRETKVQPYGPFPASERGGQEMDEARRRLAGYLNVAEDEVHFGPSTTQNTYVLAQAFRGMMQDGDEIVVTNQDHEANSGAWRRLAERGIVVREWQVDPESGQLDPGDLDSLLNDKTRVVAFPHCSNIVGHVNPVAEIAAKAQATGAVVVVDGVSYAPHGFPDIQALGADIYLFSLYKTFGPHQGLMTVKRALAERLPNQSHYFNADQITKKLTPAGPDHAQIAASAGIADYFDALHAHHFTDSPVADPAECGRQVHALLEAQEKTLLAPLLDYLRQRNDIRILGPSNPAVRAPTVAIHAKNKPAPEVVENLRQHNIAACVSNFYAVRLVEAMGVAAEPGVLRLSFVHYTSPEEIEKLIKALDQSL